MPHKNLWVFFLSLSLGLFAAAPQDKPSAENKPAANGELMIVLVSPEPQITASFPKPEDLAAFLKPAMDACTAALAKEKKPPLLLLQLTVARKRACSLNSAENRPFRPR